MLRNLVPMLLSSRLVRAGFGLAVASVAAGLLGYVFQVLMGRMLTPVQFGLFSAIIALSTFFGSPLSAIFMVISRRVSALRARGAGAVVRSMYLRTSFWIIVVGAVSLALLGAFFGSVRSLLDTDQDVLVWIACTIILTGALGWCNVAFLQAKQQFVWLGSIMVLSVIIKIILSAGFILMGNELAGALMGVLLASFAMWTIGFAITLRTSESNTQADAAPLAALTIRSVLPVLVANVAFAAMTQLDMVLVNFYFEGEDVGLYAAASVLGKAVLYLPGGIVLALFPMVAENHAKNLSSASIMMQAVAGTLAICMSAAAFYWFLGPQIVEFFYGTSYRGAGELLRWYGIAILPMALVMVAEHFLIAQGRVLFAWLFLGLAPLQLLAIHFWHAETWNVIAIIGGFGAVLVLIGYGMLLKDLLRSRTQVQG